MTLEAERSVQIKVSLSITHISAISFHKKIINIYYFYISALMWKMDKVRGHHWKEDPPPQGLFFKICLSDVNPFYIDLILILRCHPSRCREIRALQVKGKMMNLSNL